MNKDVKEQFNKIKAEINNENYYVYLEDLKKLGIDFNSKGNYKGAIQSLCMFLKYSDEDVEVLTAVGHACNNLDSYYEALSFLDEAIKLNPKHIPALSNKMIAYNKLKEFNNVITVGKQILTINDGHLPTLREMGFAYNQLKKDCHYYDAIRCFEKFLSKKNDAKVWNGLGYSYRKLEQYDKSLKCFDNAINIEKDNAEFLNNKSISLLMSNNENCIDEALNFAEKSIECKKDYIPAWINKSFIYRQKEEYDNAINTINDALKIDKYDSKLIHIKATLYLDNKNPEDAINCISNYLKLKPNNPDLFYLLGSIYYKYERYRDSLIYINKALEYNSEHIPSLYLKANVLKVSRNYNDAIMCLKKASDIDENCDFLHLYDLYGYLLNRLNKPKEAIKILKIVYNNKKYPHYSVLNNMGFAYYLNEQYKKAIDYFNKTLSKMPFNDFALLYKGMSILKIIQSGDSEYTVDAVEYCFGNTKKNLLSIISEFKLNVSEYDLLGNIILKKDNFFNKIIEKDIKNKNEYMHIYLRSLWIVNFLHANREEEDKIAHYTYFDTGKKLLLEDSPFRLCSVVKANDPEEGRVLLSFLDVPLKNTSVEYQAFIGCFTFDHDSLNQYRLYGKDKGSECTGISIILNKFFFSEYTYINPSLISMYDKYEQDNDYKYLINEEKQKDKLALFRCVYIDPKTNEVISIGHKEEYIFYRDNINLKNRDEVKEDYKEYKEHIDNRVQLISFHLHQLKKDISVFKMGNKDLNDNIIGELLVHLRYLVKHVAFKEEQECRIIRVESLSDCDLVKQEDHARMYIEYLSMENYINEVYFAPKTSDVDLFNDLIKHRGLPITCHKSEHPFF